MTAHALFPSSLPVLTEMRRTAEGREWLAGLPALVEEFRERWDLRLGAPYHGGSCSWVAPAVRADGTRVVLKVTWPHREARPEGAVLRLWAGRGAVRVLEHDAERYALLLERCEPGTELRGAGHIPAEERLLLGAGVLRELWAAGHGAGPSAEEGGERDGDRCPERYVERLPSVTGEWADRADERAARHHWPAGVDTGLFTLAAGLLRELPHSAAGEVIVHGDFNPGNLLAAERAPWLAIDTKPMYGDAAFDPWPLIQQIDDPFARPEPHRVLARRTALVADAPPGPEAREVPPGVDVTRVRAWAVARHVEYVLWSVGGSAEGHADLSDSIRLMRQTRTLTDLAGL